MKLFWRGDTTHFVVKVERPAEDALVRRGRPMTRAAPAANVAALLRRTARTWPRAYALAHGEGTCVDYATLARRVARLAANLRRAGLAPGDRVALVSRNEPGYVEALFACWWAGLVAVPVNAKLHSEGARLRDRRQR